MENKIEITQNALKHIASVINLDDNLIRDSLKHKGSRVLTFSSVLKYNRIPLPEILPVLTPFSSIVPSE